MAWPHISFIHHQTPDGRGAAHLNWLSDVVALIFVYYKCYVQQHW